MKVQVSKKLKGKICVYCSKAAATTDDHVFAREFFLLEDRNNLPKAPACRKCNEEKSKLEHYLTAVLPFAGRHDQAVDNLMQNVTRRLPKNRRLSKDLVRTMQPAWIREGSGLFLPTMTINFDSGKLEELLKLVARGLTWYHWKTYVGPAYYASVMFMPDMVTLDFQDRVRSWNSGNRVVENLGRGTVQYEGVQAADPAELTVWGISMYGGVAISSGKSRDGGPIQSSSRWWVVTAPPEVATSIERLK
jgi:hypothetical protein